MGVRFRVLLALAVGVAAFAGSYLGVREVLAHGNPCGSGGNPACGRYYAGQTRWTSNGIAGDIRTQDVAFWDSAHDTVFNWIGVSVLYGDDEWNQMGFAEGNTRAGAKASPIVYEEFQRSYCDPVYYFGDRGLVSGYKERFWVYWSGTSGPCASNPSRTVHIWYFKRTYWNNPPIDFTYDAANAGRYDAETEHMDNTHMEPNGTICFGTTLNCAANSTYALRYYTWSGDTWSLWTGSPTPYSQGGYVRTVLQNYWAFRTTGW